MYAGVKAAAVYNPTSLSDLLALRKRLPKALLWAGGTAIMSSLRQYPSSDGMDIIYLGNTQELNKINRSERYLEIGSCVTVEQLLHVGQHILHPLLERACRDSGNLLTRARATIGGALGIQQQILNIPTALSVLEAQIEIRNPESRKSSAYWIPAYRLLGRNRERIALSSAIITRVRIQLEAGDFELFDKVGSPYLEPDTAVILSVFVKFNHPAITDFRFAITFPQSGIFRSREVVTTVAGMDLPLQRSEITRMVQLLGKEIDETTLTPTPLQRERALRLFEAALHRMNHEHFRQ